MAVITEITAQKKKKDRCNIFVDGAFFCGLQAETVMKYRLKAGTAVAAEELEASDGKRAASGSSTVPSIFSQTR